MDKTWITDTNDLAAAIIEFEQKLPGFWWSLGNCSVGAHASCAVDGMGVRKEWVKKIKASHPYDSGFHCDTQGEQPAEALRDVMDQALAFIAASPMEQSKE